MSSFRIAAAGSAKPRVMAKGRGLVLDASRRDQRAREERVGPVVDGAALVLLLRGERTRVR